MRPKVCHRKTHRRSRHTCTSPKTYIYLCDRATDRQYHKNRHGSTQSVALSLSHTHTSRHAALSNYPEIATQNLSQEYKRTFIHPIGKKPQMHCHRQTHADMHLSQKQTQTVRDWVPHAVPIWHTWKQALISHTTRDTLEMHKGLDSPVSLTHKHSKSKYTQVLSLIHPTFIRGLL